MEELSEPLHEGSTVTMLSMITAIFSEARSTKMEHRQLESIFKLLHWVLPLGHRLPGYRDSRLILQRLSGMDVTKFDACSKGHVIYRNRKAQYDVERKYQLHEATCCPICKESRYYLYTYI